MADFVYNSARVAFAQKHIDWLTAAVKCALVSGVYAPLPTHNFMSAIPPGAVLARTDLVTGLGVTSSGVCFGTIPIFKAFITTEVIAAMVLYIDSGTDSSSQLVYYSAGGPGFPFLAQGFDYFVGYDLANGGWFQV